jgi:transcriptional regulator with XRE-family HTH domain
VSTAKPATPRRKPAPRSTSFDPAAAKAFGSAVRRLREESGWVQDAFAFAAGVDRSYYGKLERGERQPTFGLILRIAQTLDVPAWKVVRAAEAALEPVAAAL